MNTSAPASHPLLSDSELLHRLIGFDSTSRYSNLPIAEFICDYLDRPGIHIERNPSDDGDKVNLVVTVGPETDPTRRHGLMLSGHMDVVPAEEPEWQSNPFEMVRRDDTLVGRGTCDMKGFVALAINAAARAAATTLTSPLSLILTFDEELGTLGARHFMATWPDDKPLPRRGIIGEPTSLKVVRLHKGHAKATLTVKGTPAHSGYPHLGHNAIQAMGRAIAALGELRRELEAERGANSEFFPEVPFVALNLATIHGGSAINIVPDTCRLELGYRIMPGMAKEDFDRRIRDALGTALKDEEWSFEPLNHSPPMLLPESHDLYRKVCGLHGQRETVSASYATDAGWLQEKGFDCLLYGPGNIAVAHKPNEWLPIAEFEQCARDLETLVAAYCRDADVADPLEQVP